MPIPLPRFSLRARHALLLTLLLALAACGPAEPQVSTPPVAPLPADGLVLAFGDSLTHGAGAAVGESYPVVLERLIGRKVVRSGVPGEFSQGGLARLAAALERHEPDLLILCHGTNDFIVGLHPAATEGNLWAMIAQAEARGTPVVLVGVPRPAVVLRDGTLEAVTAFAASLPRRTEPLYGRLARAHGLPYEGAAFAEILSDPALMADPIHPNAAGYRRLAEALAELLRASGAV